jgi:hypothetical protein
MWYSDDDDKYFYLMLGDYMSKCIGYCGLDCVKCPAYIALKTNDDALRITTAAEWTKKYNHPFTKEMINCTGCTSKEEPHCGYCGMCAIRACAQKRSVVRCCVCKNFETCKTVKKFEQHSGLKLKDLP